MFALRPATPLDLTAVLPRSRAFSAHEGIAITDATLTTGLAHLLEEPTLGGVWIIEHDGAVVGYAMVTYGFDLEYGGRDAYLTELWIDEDARGAGAGTAALALLDAELRALGVGALHLQVRADNPALRLYQRAGFERSPRVTMTRVLR